MNGQFPIQDSAALPAIFDPANPLDPRSNIFNYHSSGSDKNNNDDLQESGSSSKQEYKAKLLKKVFPIVIIIIMYKGESRTLCVKTLCVKTVRIVF